MPTTYDHSKQFQLTPIEFLKKLDLLNWYRYFFIIKELAAREPKSVLEIGMGEGTIKRVIEPFVERYATMDINPKLSPDFVNDIRIRAREVENAFDCVVAADILEHIPFADLKNTLRNLHSYLRINGYALITIPHRSHYLMMMTSLKHQSRILRVPTLKRLMGRKVSIDLDHEWEIGDGHHSIKDVEEVMREAGFTIEKRQGLIYVDFWVLRR